MRVQVQREGTSICVVHSSRVVPIALLRRNGGHITPALYHDFAVLRKDYGHAEAYKAIKFRLAHLHELRRVAEEESLLEQSQWRQVETVDAYFNRDLFAKAKAQVQAYQQTLPSEASFHRVYESAEAVQV